MTTEDRADQHCAASQPIHVPGVQALAAVDWRDFSASPQKLR
jgi:hypothetical protein